MTENVADKGHLGERLISNFFDSCFSNIFSFPNPKTHDEVEVADVLVWWNRIVLLIEVKTRDGGGKTANDWGHQRIGEAVSQITGNYRRLQNKERVNLHNEHYNVALDYHGLDRYMGLVVLVSDESLSLRPTDSCADIYEKDLPIHVVSWKDLLRMVGEVDTVPDLIYYLSDRYELLQRGIDIPLDCEMHVLGCYKLNENSFPRTTPDFSVEDVWRQYTDRMRNGIERRNQHNRYAQLFDHIASLLPQRRKLYDGLPTGLYFAWELAALSRRQRAYYGEKLKSVEEWFKKGKSTRQFALFNQATGNWIVFLFSKQEPREIEDRLIKLADLKLIKEVENTGFSYGVYALGFQVSTLVPPRFELVRAIFNGADSVKGYTEDELAEAQREWGKGSNADLKGIQEFPSGMA